MSRRIRRGTQLRSHLGFVPFLPDRVYYLLDTSSTLQKICCVTFSEQEKKTQGKDSRKRLAYVPPKATLVYIDQDRFEVGISSEQIVANGQTIEDSSEMSFSHRGVEALDAHRNKSSSRSHADRVEAHIRHFETPARMLEQMLFSSDPKSLLRDHARRCVPPQNVTRYVPMFLMYVASNFSRNVLAYRTQNIGRWDRSAQILSSPGEGESDGKPITRADLIDDVCAGFETFQELGRPYSQIYRMTCQRFWDCDITTGDRGLKKLCRPGGLPMLDEGQARYWIEAVYGSDAIIRATRGDAYFREECAPSRGKTTEAVIYFGERTEYDGQWLKEQAMMTDGITPHPPIIRVTSVDVAIGQTTGIGFSLGGESAAAYRMSKLCQAMDKVEFCKWFGITISPEQWPSMGLSDEDTPDRGAGSTQAAESDDLSVRATFKSLPPTGFGQGKPNIESNHDKSINLRERPTHVQTRLSLIDIVRREIRKVIARNETKNISSRLTPRLASQVDRPTSNGLFEYFSKTGRDRSRTMHFDDVIRAFATPMTFQVKDGWIYYHTQRYGAPKLQEANLLCAEIDGFVVDIVAHYVWIDLHGELIECEAQIALNEDIDQTYLSISEIDALNKRMVELNRNHGEHRNAVIVEAAKAFEDETGQDFWDGSRKHGRAKRPSRIHAAVSAIKNAVTPRATSGRR